MRLKIYLHIILLLLLSMHLLSEEITDLPYSAPDQLVALTQESTKVGKLINPLSGQPCLRQTDLIAKGAQDIILKRTFISQYRDWHANQNLLMTKRVTTPPQIIESGWVIFPHTRLDHLCIVKRKHHKNKTIKNEVRIVDQSGVALTFNIDSNETNLVDKPYGICNSYSADELPSGQYDFRNIKIVNHGKSIDVHSPHGSIYHYGYRTENIINDHDSRTIMYQGLFYLAKETLPNGKILRYHYNKEKELVRIDSLDPKERYVYSSLNVNSSPFKSISTFSTNTGKTASYQQQPRKKIHHQIKSSRSSQSDNRALNLLSITAADTPYYQNETMSFDKALLNNYSARRNLFACEYAETGEHLAKSQRVSKLLLPSDPAGLNPIYEFSYLPPLVGQKAGNTTVRNTDGTFVIYEYSDKLLLTEIKHYGADHILKKKKQLNWSDNHWLSSVEMQDGSGQSLYKKSYQYDAFGNPILEIFSGDLSGKGIYENIVITRQFSQDGRHLLFKEKNDEGKVFTFKYLENTNLITRKFTKDNNKILRREFHEYDDCNNLIKTIQDNGSSKDKNDLTNATQRKITNYILRNQPPFLHLPEWIEEKYLENGSEMLLKRTHLSYDIHGNESEISVYGADGNLAYILHKNYNDRGNLIAETNALGQQATYEHDDKGRQISSINFSKNIQTKTTYDRRDRIIKIEEMGNDHICHSTSFQYDLNDHLTKKIDSFQNVTEYSYDPLSHKVTKTRAPSVVDKDGKSIPVTTTSAYDAFGREISKTDANGNITTFRYGGHPLPIEIIHPDYSRESFRYTRKGLLESHVNQEGLKTSYCYDVLGRIISKSYSTPEGEIAKETFIYDNYHLIEKTDLDSTKTSYSYDGAGRLATEATSDKVVKYEYDPLGRISTIIAYNGENTLFTHFKRDLLDRVLEKQCTDANGNTLSKISYSYDSDGNIATITQNINGNDATDSFLHDSFKRQLEAVDAFGNRTNSIYNENAVNALGQKVLQITTIDPKNRQLIKTEDAHGNIVQEDVILADKLIKSHKMAYDPNGNLLCKRDFIYQNGEYQRTIETEYAYTPLNTVKSLTRAANSPNSRTILYSYTPSGKIASKIKPDRTVLSYNYDPLGHLKTISSSDNQLKLSFERNRTGDLLHAKDEVNNVWIQRNVDPHGNTLREEFSTGLAIEKSYDAFNRPLTINLPDQGRVLYTYDPLYLRKVSKSSSGKTLYSHQYTTYDSSGHLQEESLLNGLGTVKHAYDCLGRKVSISSPYFSQTCQYDEVDNVVAMTTNGNEIKYAYDELDQLTSEGNESYQYDTNGNRIIENDTKWTVNELDELQSTNDIQCTYDLNGNLISKQTPKDTLTFSYDPLDRLIRVKSGDKTVKMLYDPIGRRLSKITENQMDSTNEIENYLYDGENEIGAFTGEGKPIQQRILGLAYHKNSPSTVAIEIGGKVLASLQDFQGNTRLLIDSITNKQNAAYNFSAFGRQTHISEALFNPWRYASKRLDPELNLINFGKRYYDSQLSRWFSTDPAGFTDGFNLYAFVRNNPYRYSDPNGQYAIPVFVPVIEVSFNFIVSWLITNAIPATVIGTLISVGVYQLDKALDKNENDIALNNEAVTEEVEVEKKKKKKPARTNPLDLEEKLALEEAKGGSGKQIMEEDIKDPNYPIDEWQKTGHSHKHRDGTITDVHYWQNVQTSERTGFKFKDGEENHKSRAYLYGQ